MSDPAEHTDPFAIMTTALPQTNAIHHPPHQRAPLAVSGEIITLATVACEDYPVDPVQVVAGIIGGIIKAAIKKLAQPTPRERLVKRARKHPEAPKLGWRQRRRLMKLLNTKLAKDALGDQDRQGAKTLSALLATHVFRAPESPDAMRLADVLIAEYPAAVDQKDAAAVLAHIGRRTANSISELRRSIDDGRVADVNTAVAGYRQMIEEELAPVQLFDRDTELADLARFCAGNDWYAWWQADAWAGKTALMAHFALHPPEGTDVVYFFIRGARIAAESNSVGFIAKVVPQLAALTGRPLPADWTGPNSVEIYLDLRSKAAKHAEANGRRLLLIVDGLDEDTRPPNVRAVTELLPRTPKVALRVIVASRPIRNILTGLRSDHPLHTCSRTILRPSKHARDIAQRAQDELHELIAGDTNDRDLVGLIAAAEGPLTADDLAKLTGKEPFQIRDVLSSRAARSLKAHTDAVIDNHPDPGYVLGHDALREQANRELDATRINAYRTKICRWADDYAQQHWPPHTPAYLLLSYPQMLHNQRLTEQLHDLATDLNRHDRLVTFTGGDAAVLADISAALDLLVDEADPDLEQICMLARHRDTLRATDDRLLPEQLDARDLCSIVQAFARAGDLARTERLARAIYDDAQRATGLSLAAITAAKGLQVDRARQLLNESETIARALGDPVEQAEALTSVAANAAEAGEFNHAIRITETITDPDIQARVLRRISEVAARGGNLKRAKEIAATVNDPWQHAKALSTIAAATARAGELEDAERIAATITGLDVPHEVLSVFRDIHLVSEFGAKEVRPTAQTVGFQFEQTQALIAIAEAAAEKHDIDAPNGSPKPSPPPTCICGRWGFSPSPRPRSAMPSTPKKSRAAPPLRTTSSGAPFRHIR